MLDKDSPVPLYYQIQTIIEEHIDSGEWKPGMQVPSERQLCDHFQVSRITVRQALEALANQGRLLRRQGRGTFVASPRIEQKLSRLTGFTQDMESRGHDPGARVLRLEAVPAPAPAARALEMLTFANGVFATIDASWSRPPYWPTWGGLGFEMVTERGSVVVDAFSQNLTVYQHSTRRATWRYWGSDANQAMIEEFVAAISQDRAPRVTGQDGYRALEAALAAYESAATGQPVALE